MGKGNYISDVVNGVIIIKTPADAAGVTVGADSNNTAGTVIGTLSIVETLASTAYKTNIPGVGLTLSSLGNNIDEAYIDYDNKGVVDDNTMISLGTDILSLVSIGAAVVAAPEILALAAISATALSLYNLTTDDSTDISNYWLDILNKTQAMITDFDLTDSVNKWLSGTPTTAPLPGLDAFNYFDPNSPDNHNPNDGNPLNPGDGHPMDDHDFTPPRRDPLVLDTDKDGFISTTTLEESQAYFDITGDGIKEKVSWIKANDGILVYDKNENGKIEGIDEVFGNSTTSGFEELSKIADSNYDGKIDRKDELYSRLKVWHDDNQDGISQSEELKTLKEEGIASIDLNAVSTDIELGGATLSEASKYTDLQGNKELAADVKLAFDSRITNIDTQTLPDYTEYPESQTLPFLRGYGVVHDTTIAYNLDDNFRALAMEFAGDVQKTANEFDKFMDGWSGYNALQTQLQEKYALDTPPKLCDLDRKVWTYEHFMGRGNFSSGIEARLESTAASMKNGGSDTAPSGRYNASVVERVYNDFSSRNQAFFSLEAFYADIFDGVAEHKRGVDEFVIHDKDALHTNISNYLNDPNNSIEEKLYLVEQTNRLKGVFLDFTPEAISADINNALLKDLVVSIYNDSLETDIYNTEGIRVSNALLLGSDTEDTIEIQSSNATVLAQEGDDNIVDTRATDTRYIYRKGDGSDTVYDRGGSDTLQFSDIAASEILIKSDGDDLVLALSEAGKTFDELSDKVRIVDFANSANRIENITFADGSSLAFKTLINSYFISEDSDTIELTNTDDTVDALGGDDTVKAFSGNDTITGGKGNDTLDGGSGNDTYIFNLGDGQDTIIDASGNDTVKLGNGITQDMLEVQRVGSDLILAIKEDGVAFADLKDKITVKNSSVENVELSDGANIEITLLQTPSENDDTLLYANSVVNVDALGGNDTVTTGSGADTVTGGSGDDTIATNAGSDTIDGGEGADIINAGSGADTITGGTGDDTYNHDDKIKSKNTTQKSLNNIYTLDTFTFIKKQDIMTDYFKRVA